MTTRSDGVDEEGGGGGAGGGVENAKQMENVPHYVRGRSEGEVKE